MVRRAEPWMAILVAAAAWVAPLSAADGTTVDALRELVVFDPAARQPAVPPVHIRRRADHERMTVDIPPAVHVHRYYYSGDKEIHAPLLRGGPTVVVANHPKTGCRMYIDVMLPPGAPRIAYDRHGITYVYPRQRVRICFSHLPLLSDRVRVQYKSGRGVRRAAGERKEELAHRFHTLVNRCELAAAAHQAAAETGRLIAGVAGAADAGAARLVDTVRRGTHLLPGVTAIADLADRRAERMYRARLRRAALRQAQRPGTVRTNR